MNIRKESGIITADREEFLRICTDFYKSLYDQTKHTLESTVTNYADSEDMT